VIQVDHATRIENARAADVDAAPDGASPVEPHAQPGRPWLGLRVRAYLDAVGGGDARVRDRLERAYLAGFADALETVNRR
jgi:hypothetical protein